MRMIWPTASAHLVTDRVIRHADMPLADLNKVLCKAGFGCDHILGEIPIAFVPDRGGFGALLTTHALIVRLEKEGFRVGYRGVRSVTVEPGFARDKVTIKTDANSFSFSFFKAEPAGRFVEALCGLSPDSRCGAPAPLVVATDGDSSGVARSRRRMRFMERRCQMLQKLVQCQVQAGALPANKACGLVARIELLYRSTFGGRGMRGEAWISALDAGELLEVMRKGPFGRPTAEVEERDDRVLSFGAASMAGDVAKNVAGRLMANAVGIGFRVGPSVRDVEVRIRPLEHGCGYVVRAGRGGELSPASYVDPALLVGVHGMLLDVEARLLMARILEGPEVPTTELLEREQATLQAACKELAPELLTDAMFSRLPFRKPAQVLVEGYVAPPDRPGFGPPAKLVRTRAAPVKRSEDSLRGAGVAQIIAGLLNLFVFSWVLWFGAAVFSTMLVQITGLGIFSLLSLGPCVLLPLGVLEVLSGAVVFSTGSRAKGLAVAVAALEILSVCVGGLFSGFAGLMTLVLAFRPAKDAAEQG
jgi:hypothetical protein